MAVKTESERERDPRDGQLNLLQAIFHLWVRGLWLWLGLGLELELIGSQYGCQMENSACHIFFLWTENITEPERWRAWIVDVRSGD